MRAHPRQNPSWRTRLPFFYGWVVLGSAFLVQGVSYGANFSFSVFLVALVEEFGWGRGPASAAFSIFVLVMGFAGVGAGVLLDRFGPSRVLPAGGIVLALGLGASSLLSELWQLYLFYGVITGVGVALTGWVVCAPVVSRWFQRRQGLAMGIGSAGIGLSIVVWVPFCEYLISSFGWRTTYQVMAVLALVLIAPQAALLQVGRPEELGLRPDGSPADGDSDSSRRVALAAERRVVDKKWASRPWPLGAAARTARFWLLGGNVMLSIITTQMLWVHQVAYLVDSGYDRMLAAAVSGAAGFVSMPAKVLWGAASDRLGRELAYTMGAGTILVSIVVLVAARSAPSVGMVALFAVTFAVGYAVCAPLQPAATADIFGGRHLGSIYGVLSAGAGLGSAFGAWLAGFVYDAAGSYLVAFAVAGACSAASVLCMAWAAPRKVRRVVGQRATQTG